MIRFVSLFFIFPFLFLGCDNAYYNTMEKFGYHKRDLLVDRVEDTRDAQNDAKVQFESALEEFSAVTDFSGGKLEDKYKKLKTELERSEVKTRTLRKHISDVESVSDALFKEWESELSQYNNNTLLEASKLQLQQTRHQYTQLIDAMKRAEAKIEPVLSVFRDQVLYLKHNLNSQAIASLQYEFDSVKTDVGLLIKEMESSIAEADAFIEAMAKE
ncbi:MAG TPA: DUF2959 domain-containing protein [Sedimentisphaerales bacterium]|nr:DUF2959 domain-containing protein [Sedimentisphaerales bacterium]